MSLPESPIRFRDAPLNPLGEGFYEVAFFALGSECSLFFEAPSQGLANAYRSAACHWLDSFEKRFSRFLPDSDLSRVNAMAGTEWAEIDTDFEILLDLCQHYHFVTKGAFDATSLPLSLLWDWRRARYELPSVREIETARRLVNWPLVQRSPGRVFLPEPGMMLDFGGIGKEFAVDCLRQIAIGMGIEQIIVNLGRDIAVHGDSPDEQGWYLGIEDPQKAPECFCGVRLPSGTAVATSGDYRRHFNFNGTRYSHILDCRTGWPIATGVSAVTVIAPRCTTAGLLSTSAMILGVEATLGLLNSMGDAEAVLWCKGELYETPGFRTFVNHPTAAEAN